MVEGIKMAVIYELIKQAEVDYRDKLAKEAGFIIAIPGELYTRSLGKRSEVYIDKICNNWEVWRESYMPDKKAPINFKIIASSKDFEYVILKAKKYFRYIEKKQRVSGK